MDYFAQQLINGLVLGSIYGLIAIGYTMVYGIVGMINFAHGDIFMIGGFIALITFLILVSFGLTAIPLILLIVQLASSGGTYPVETAPQGFQLIHNWVPVTQSVFALRHAITGAYEGQYPTFMLFLLSMAVVGGALGLLGRRRWEFVEDEDRIYGRGACDMKGGLAASIIAAVPSIYQAKSGMRVSVIPGARSRRIDTMSSMAAESAEISTKVTPSSQTSALMQLSPAGPTISK